ncbi:MAG TPA: hypothetical protein VNO70_17855 [Blastocatellia bacterium]|nr:hypothetical protein [Blastocatellia bacterium]
MKSDHLTTFNDCPRCGFVNETDAHTCDCGYKSKQPGYTLKPPKAPPLLKGLAATGAQKGAEGE